MITFDNSYGVDLYIFYVLKLLFFRKLIKKNPCQMEAKGVWYEEKYFFQEEYFHSY